ncbi:MAG: hypothetical protein OEO77_13740 [Acidimicrobiia bacterium]|nr:hypothetical protein [Acidimicrobiia bacterium]
MLKRIGLTLARAVGLIVVLFGGWVFTINVIEDSYSGVTRAWILTSGVLGVVGGVLYLLSFDGSERFRSRRFRTAGWVGMLVLGLVPWSFSFLMLPMILMTIPTLALQPPRG